LTQKYQPHPEAAIVACYFNAKRSPYRIKAFHYFYQSIQHLHHSIVECTIGNSTPQLPKTSSIHQVRATSLLWHKETLLNRAIAELDERFKYIFWLDADVLFTNPNWLVEGVERLQTATILQPFEYCLHLERDRFIPAPTPLAQNPQAWRSFCATLKTASNYQINANHYDCGNVGFAWGARRSILAAVPLFERALVGGADRIVAHAAAGQIPHPLVEKAFGDNLIEVERWSSEFYAQTEGKIGYVTGDLYHLWHGNLSDRQYITRSQDFKGKTQSITERDEQGLFTTDDPQIDRYMQGYFDRREVKIAAATPTGRASGSQVSLAMTVYNRENYLPIALDSILTQTYPHWHLTIWDDGSTDSSPAIAREYAQLDPRIKFIPAPHTGRGNALRAALAASSHKYLAWIDSDDILAPEALAATVDILDRHPQFGMVYTDHSIIDERGRSLGTGARCQIPYSKERLLIDFMTFHFRLIRREIYDLCGRIDLDFPQAEDYDLCLKISEVTEIYHLQQPLYYYRIHPNTSSVIHRDLQLECSATAVRNALARRGLSDRYQLNVSPTGLFRLHPRNSSLIPTKKRVLIVATELYWQGISRLPSGLNLAGLSVAALCHAQSYLAMSSYLEQKIFWQGSTQNFNEAIVLQAIDAIISIAPSLVIPGDESAVLLLHEILKRASNLPNLKEVETILQRSLCKSEYLNRTISKEGFINFCKSLSVRVPENHRVDSEAEAVIAASMLGYPVVIKGSLSYGGCMVRICSNEAELKLAAESTIGKTRLSNSFNIENSISIQQYIRGQISMFVFVAAEGKILSHICVNKVLSFPSRTGPSSVIKTIECPEMDDFASKIVSAVNYNGFGAIDFILEAKTDRPYAIEFNTRPTSMCHLGARLGANMCAALREFLESGSYQNEPILKDLVVALFPNEYHRDPHSPYLQLVESPDRRDCFHDVPWDEPELIKALSIKYYQEFVVPSKSGD
jgi:glycosyltransferase involved in cell wall biosynthesis/D-alanine-D-alanine ligase-like ATP-grasp enzyme